MLAIQKVSVTMQIRIRGLKTEFLRAVYDPIAKRTKQKLIEEKDFTEAEKEQFLTWKSTRNSEQEKSSLQFAAQHSANKVDVLARAVEAGHPVGDPVALLAALDRLNAALRKRGVTRPPKGKAAPAKPA